MLHYHQAAFLLLAQRLKDKIEYALLTSPVAVRARHITDHLPVDQEVAADVAWPVARDLLEVLEAEMAEVLRKRSVFFWMHIYRRIVVMLHPYHGDKTDPRTVALVRQIVELVIAKHGRATDANEIVRSNQVKPDLILGGFMRAGIKALFKNRFTKTYRECVKYMRTSPTWVVRDFTEQDFIGMYRVEGFAYHYWRATALLRALGKGARIIVHEDGDWDYVADAELSWLIKSIDERTEEGRLGGSLLGTWIDEEIGRKEVRELPVVNYMICPVYNVHRVSPGDFLRKLGARITGDYVSNFLPGFFDARLYLQAHRFLSDAFRARHGYSLEAFVATLWAIAHVVFFPGTVLLTKTEGSRREMFRQNLMNVLQRGYSVFGVDHDKAVPELLQRIDTFLPGVNVTEAEIRAVLDRLTLKPPSQAGIALWSGGPRYLLIPAGSQQAVDLQGVPMMLATLFFGVAHDQGHRGTVFEEAFRRALTDRGFEVQSGRLSSVDGASKELDAGVIVGGDLFAFECVSVQRPLDYEIGRPATFAARRERLDGKVEQVLELVKFLEANPRGTNYDYTRVGRIVPLVVSPFVEWLWDRSARLWLSDGTPRILSSDEALNLMEQARRKAVS